jgi:hypothetical protein
MSNPDEDFDLSHAEDKNAKNNGKSSNRLAKSKGAPSKKRKREIENSLIDKSEHKRAKTSSTTNLKDDEEQEVDKSEDKNDCGQRLIQEYNHLKRIYEDERVNQQTHLYLRRMAHDKAEQVPFLSKYPLLHYF